MKKPRVLAILGPTATGKTALGIGLAQRLGGEVVSCDSMQIYKGLPIGTAQPTPQELSQAPHHLIGFLGVDEPFSASDYVSLAAKTIGEITARGRLPVLVGGTGLYARSLLRGFAFDEGAKDEALRAQLFAQTEEQGPQALYARLQALDPQGAGAIHPHNVKRVVRALEVCLLTGGPFSQQAARSRQAEAPYRPFMLCPTFADRQLLYGRINKRVDLMLEEGLLQEAEGFYRHCQRAGTPPTAAQAIGYKELFPYFQGETTLEEAVEKIKQESRRYAKRQLTWFSREPDAHFLCLDGLTPAQALDQGAAMARAWLAGGEGKGDQG